jgi:simple sugar transport system ATP-binding protein
VTSVYGGKGAQLVSATSERTTQPILSIRNISKQYGRISALDNVSLDLWPGEILAVVGDNGAGKSTLLRILSGDLKPTSGEILVGSEPVAFEHPADATDAGIGSVYQDLSLALNQGIAANFFAGREISRGGSMLHWLHWLDEKKMEATTDQALKDMRIRILDLSVPCASLSGGQRQAVAIARAIYWCKDILLLDEPTAALGVEQQKHSLGLMRESRDRGVGIILVSHQLPHVLDVADRTIVLRRGRVTAEFTAEETTEHGLVAAITGFTSEVVEDGDRRV